MSLLSHNLTAFYEICLQGTVHGAAKKMGLTQTAVTQRLQSLEADLNATLFIRSRRGMSLTPAGESLARYCKLALDLEGETLAALHENSGPVATRLAIEGPSSILRARVIPALVGTIKQFPQVSFEFRMSDIISGVTALKRGDADLAVIKRQDVVDEFDSRLLKPERYVLVGSPEWAKRPLADIVKNERIIDFDPSDDMTYMWLEKFDLRDKVRGERHFVNNTDALASLIALGAGYSVLAADFAKPLVERGELIVLGGGKSYDFEVALAWYPRRHPAVYWQKTLAAIK